MRSLARFVRLDPSERRLLVESLLLVAAYRLGLAVLPTSFMLRRGEGRSRAASRPADASGELAASLEWAVGAASRRVPGARCLAQALAARHQFARHGFSSSLCFGGRRKGDGRLDAHAWLESRGQVVYGDARSELFTPLGRTPHPPEGRSSA